MERMAVEGEYVDDTFMQIAANVLNRMIIIVPVIPTRHVSNPLGLICLQPQDGVIGDHEPLYLMYYSEGRFSSPHYQSIRPRNPNNLLRDFIRGQRIDRSHVRITPPDGEGGNRTRPAQVRSTVSSIPDGSIISPGFCSSRIGTETDFAQKVAEVVVVWYQQNQSHHRILHRKWPKLRYLRHQLHQRI